MREVVKGNAAYQRRVQLVQQLLVGDVRLPRMVC